MSLTPRQAVEIFHLQFLRVLNAGPGNRHLIVKGGCNLRFFFQSVRYSEDLDCDVVTIAKETLQRKIHKILSSPPLIPILKTHGLSIDQVSAPKQTETTQRWKIALTIPGWATPIRTRLEFSRRGASSAVAFEPIDGAIARSYGVTPPLAHHYTDAEAVRQKIYALAGRTETQARDVFDLHLLFARRKLEIPREDALKDMARQAIERAMSLSFDEYAGQVVAFLVPEHADLYGSKAHWEAMQHDIVTSLKGLAQ
jgi:predicted nucleotidyltransferase component of viral defense system